MAKKPSTGYGRRMDTESTKARGRANVQGAAAALSYGGAAGFAATGNVPMTVALGTMAATQAIQAREEYRTSKRATAKGHAVEGLIARGRGGSAALGQHDVVPHHQSMGMAAQAAMGHLGATGRQHATADQNAFAGASHRFTADHTAAIPAGSGSRPGWGDKARAASLAVRQGRATGEK